MRIGIRTSSILFIQSGKLPFLLSGNLFETTFLDVSHHFECPDMKISKKKFHARKLPSRGSKKR